MLNFNNEDKRWLEIVFYLLCRKIFSNNNKQSDVIDFITGFRWTNMFDYDTLVSTIVDQKLLIDPRFAPSRQEFIVSMNDPNCRLRLMKAQPIRELIKDTEYKYSSTDIFHAKMKEEIHQTLLYPKLTNKSVHAAIYSFLIAVRYVADLVKNIKF